MQSLLNDPAYGHKLRQAYGEVSRVSSRLWPGLWPDDSVPRDTPHSRIMLGAVPEEEVRIPAVSETTDVKADDLVVVIDTAGSSHAAYDILGVLTGREVMGLGHVTLKVARVVSTAAKTISVVTVPTPADGWECDLANFADRAYDSVPTTLTLKTKTRRIGRLGTVEEVRQRIREHALFNEWKQEYENAKDVQRGAQEAAMKRQADEARRQEALRKIGDIVNRALGSDLFCMDAGGRVVFAYQHSFLQDAVNLRVHLAGLHALGRFTDDEYDLVRDQLAIAGLLPARQ
ncbi:hypothetical protein [Streptomyces nitrosporeus]|uniref:hypothetical protein n=1 Tax=Streptomyces nitrosporeus TaxID=28894 RepID=UPI0039A0830C